MLNRRSFLARTGTASLGLSVSTAVLLDFFGTKALAREAGSDALRFGALEPLVTLMQETSPDALLGVLVARLRGGEKLETLVASCALANARTFGGENYDGYHCFMALMPSLAMAERMAENERALPVLKVIHRTATRIAAHGGREKDVLACILPPAAADSNAPSRLLGAVHACDLNGAEQAFAALAAQGQDETLRALAPIVREEMDVHRVVLAWRAYETLKVTGDENAKTLLRQCVHFCATREKDAGTRNTEVREIVPRLVRDHRLEEKGSIVSGQPAENDAIVRLADRFFGGSRAEAAEAMAKALADGWCAKDVGEALSVAATRLLLEDQGLKKSNDPEKPVGSVHGASTGVHASDSAHAWRQLARVLPQKDKGATLVAAAYHTGGQAGNLGEHFTYAKELAELENAKTADLLLRLDSAINAANQAAACAAAQRLLEQGGSGEELILRILPFSVADEGALHAEKYFRTATDLYTISRPEFRDRHLVALARVAASQHVYPAACVVEARALLAGKA